jgi:hypothetical protein
MATQKFLQHNGSGGFTEVTAASTSTVDAIVAADGTGRISSTFMPAGIGADTISLPTSEDLAAGNLVNIYDATGTATARKANATDNTKPCHGFVLAAVTSPANALVYLEGPITALSGLTAGASQFLSAETSGALTANAPSGTGKIVQFIGTAVNATTVDFEKTVPITLA